MYVLLSVIPEKLYQEQHGHKQLPNYGNATINIKMFINQGPTF